MKITAADLALAHELRCEYRLYWKQIGDITGHDPKAIYDAVRRALVVGVRHA